MPDLPRPQPTTELLTHARTLCMFRMLPPLQAPCPLRKANVLAAMRAQGCNADSAPWAALLKTVTESHLDHDPKHLCQPLLQHASAFTQQMPPVTRHASRRRRTQNLAQLMDQVLDFTTFSRILWSKFAEQDPLPTMLKTLLGSPVFFLRAETMGTPNRNPNNTAGI